MSGKICIVRAGKIILFERFCLAKPWRSESANVTCIQSCQFLLVDKNRTYKFFIETTHFGDMTFVPLTYVRFAFCAPISDVRASCHLCAYFEPLRALDFMTSKPKFERIFYQFQDPKTPNQKFLYIVHFAKFKAQGAQLSEIGGAVGTDNLKRL